MLSENLQIYRDLFELSKALLTYQVNVPRMVRYGEYGKAVALACEAMDMVYVANNNQCEREWATVRILQTTGGIRSRVRLFLEMGYLGKKQGTYLALLIDKIQKQAIGWRNKTIRQSREAAMRATREDNPVRG